MSDHTAMQVDADFPGGNACVEAVEGDRVTLHQDLRDTEGWWFYWCFRVRGAAGRALTFHFTDRNVFAARGPAVSVDAGVSWEWLGAQATDGPSFRYAFPDGVEDVRFCLGMPYLAPDLHAFIARHADNPHLRRGTLCTTRKGRPVELLRAGRLDGHCSHRVVLTCRHHACEMMANYLLEGIIEGVLADTPTGAWLREHVEVLAVPFMDKDGVEGGDQGKDRRPHDHNRDYGGRSIHVETAALRRLVPQWSCGDLRLALDLHCPWIRAQDAGRDEQVHFVGLEAPAQWPQLEEFSRILEAVRTGPVLFSARHNLPSGTDWNTPEHMGPGMTCAAWMFQQPGVRLAASMELPYANAGGVEVNPVSARALGHDLAAAVRGYLGG